MIIIYYNGDVLTEVKCSIVISPHLTAFIMPKLLSSNWFWKQFLKILFVFMRLRWKFEWFPSMFVYFVSDDLLTRHSLFLTVLLDRVFKREMSCEAFWEKTITYHCAGDSLWYSCCFSFLVTGILQHIMWQTGFFQSYALFFISIKFSRF